MSGGAVLGRPNLIIGGLLMALGLALVGPSLVTSLRYRPVSGVVLDAFPRPLDDGRVELAVVYEYEIDPEDLPGGGHALGYARCDRFGRLQGDLVLSQTDAGHFIERIRAKPLATRVYYQPDEPLTTAMARITTGGGLWLSWPVLGMVLVVAPPLTWIVLLVLRTRW